MNCAPTLTAEEFKQIHNGLCDLRHAIDRLDGVLAHDVFKLLTKAREQISVGLVGAYEQDTRSFDSKNSHYESVQKDLNLDAIWSMYEIDDLNQSHPFEGVTKVVYRNHWGRKSVSCTINGNTWAALYVAANACIRDSADNHHVFIENFTKEDDNLILSTGS